MAAPILHINGWAGSGKRTIAQIVAAETGARLIDNHTLLNPVTALYDRDAPRAPEFRQRLRSLVFDELRQLPEDQALVFTDAQADDAYCRGLFADVAALAEARRADLTALILEIEEAENIRRLTDSARKALSKLTRPEILTDLRQTETLLTGPADRTATLDVTRLSAPEAAANVVKLWQAHA